MSEKKKYALDVDENRLSEKQIRKYIRKIVREEVEKYFEKEVPDFE